MQTPEHPGPEIELNVSLNLLCQQCCIQSDSLVKLQWIEDMELSDKLCLPTHDNRQSTVDGFFFIQCDGCI